MTKKVPINVEGKLMKTKDQYIVCLTLKLKEWDAQIDYLTTKVENSAYIKRKHIEELDALHAKQLVAAEKMKELQETTGDAWILVAQTANKDWDNLRIGIATASFKLNQA
jgi:hypothetical protein